MKCQLIDYMWIGFVASTIVLDLVLTAAIIKVVF